MSLSSSVQLAYRLQLNAERPLSSLKEVPRTADLRLCSARTKVDATRAQSEAPLSDDLVTLF